MADPLHWISTIPAHKLPRLESETESAHPSPLDIPEKETTEVINLSDNDDSDFRTIPNFDTEVGEGGEEEERVIVAPVDRPQMRDFDRINRGIPRKKYDPEYEAKRSRYPVSKMLIEIYRQSQEFFSAALCKEQFPRSVQEALGQGEWKKAMEEEIEALAKNGTWEKSVLPVGKRLVVYRWVFTIKRKADGSIERYKARLVAKGYTQTYGVDYSETFSHVAKMDTIRVLFSIAANKNLPLYQFDVKNAFLHGDLGEEVYMEPPHGFSKDFGDQHVCRLKKALYGLKQSPRAWFGRFTVAMKMWGYRQSNGDHTLFIKRRRGHVTCLIIYVDDIVITGDDSDEIQRLKKSLFTEFEMKDLGNLKYFLGIEVLRSQKGIFISQRKYILDLLAETGMLDCKPAETPIVVNHGLQIVEGAKTVDRERYQRLVGKMIYLSHTRPDVAYAMGILSQFMHCPQEDHISAAYRILRYLKGTSRRGVLFQNHGHLEIKAYTDAD